MKTTKALIAELNEGRDPGDPVLTYRQLDYWYRHGYIPGAAPAPGTGNERFVDEQDERIIRLMAPLVHFGLTVPAASAIAQIATTNGLSEMSLPIGDFVLHYSCRSACGDSTGAGPPEAGGPAREPERSGSDTLSYGKAITSLGEDDGDSTCTG